MNRGMLCPTGTSRTSRNIFARHAVTYYMADVHHKRTGRRAVRRVELSSSSTVGKHQRIAETPADTSGARLHLTTKESEVLQLLAENPGRIFSRGSLLKMIWGYADGVVSRTADIHIQRLRRKLKGDLAPTIYTVFGRRYVLEYPGKPDVTSEESA